MNARELSDRLAHRADSVAAMLLPAGKRVGREWKVGGIAGEKGESLSVCISGEKRGTWKDFATGEGGDLIDLWSAVRRLTLAEAIREVKAHLGVPAEPKFGGPKREYSKPVRSKSIRKVSDSVSSWLNKRGITDKTIADFRLASEGGHVLVMPYLRDGELVNVKYRDIRDKSRQRQEKGAEPCLFGWHLIDPNARSVAITEGEADAMVLHQLGFPALSVNQGAGNHQWIESDWDRLERFSDIVLCFDSDQAGQKGVKEVITRLGVERCRICVFPAKDANEYLLAGGDDHLQYIAEARPLAPDELVGVEQFEDQVIRIISGLDAEDSAPLFLYQEHDWLRFRPGEVTVWTGHSGHGKSQVLGLLALGLMAKYDERWCFFSGEMQPARMIERMVRQASCGSSPTIAFARHAIRKMAGKFFLFNVLGQADSKKMFSTFAYAARRHAVGHVVVDSLMMLSDVPEEGRDALEKQRLFMAETCAFAARHGVHVHLVAHPRKAANEDEAPGKQDVSGSGKIIAMAHNIISVWARLSDEVKVDAEGNEYPDAKLELRKQRNGETQHRNLWLWFDKRSRQYCMNQRRNPIPFFDEDFVPQGVEREV